MKLTPDVLSSKVEGASAVYALDLAPDLAAFDGHYPGNPILAGVVQVDWAMRYAREAFPIDWNGFSGIEQLKFHKLITPGEPLELKLDWNAETGRVAFVYESAGERKSAGQIRVSAR